MRNSIDDNFYFSGKNSHDYVVIPVNSWVDSKNYEGSLLYRTQNLTLIDTNDTVVNYYTQLNKKDFELAGIVNINYVEIEELATLPCIGVKTAEKNIIKRNEFGRYNALEEIILVPGIGSKIYAKISSHIRVN